MGYVLRRRGVLRAGSVVIASSLSGCGVFSPSTPPEEVRYVFARVVDEAPPGEEITDYSDERVQENEYARELVPEAVNDSNGYAENWV